MVYILGSNEGSIATKVADRTDSVTQSILDNEKISHLPAITVADDIITPDPFRDVIKTEPAPDLGHLMGEILPFIYKPPSTKPPLPTPSNNKFGFVTEKHNDGTNAHMPKPVLFGLLPAHTSPYSINKTKNSSQSPTNKGDNKYKPSGQDITKNFTQGNFGNKINPEELYPDGETDVQDYDDDSFSLASVLGMIFSDEGKKPKPSRNQPNNTHTIQERISNVSDDTFFSENSNTSEWSNKPNYTHRTNCSRTENCEIKNGGISSAYNEVSIGHKHQYASSGDSPVLSLETSTSRHFPPMSVPDPGAASGLLKLAGCNIYGRMYRVGRIITELSGPCLECMCTEVGVQCRQLSCLPNLQPLQTADTLVFTKFKIC